MKLHLIDIRLRNNAGMNFPVCKASERLLDLDASRWPLASSTDYRETSDKSVFCKHCVRTWAKRYAWAPLEK